MTNTAKSIIPIDTKTGLPAWPYFEEDEIAAACEILRSGRVNYWTGQATRDFEHEFAGYFGSRYSVAVSNGTVALELALRALGIGEGDEVIVTARTFIASASAVVMCGAVPIMCDVSPESGNITADTVQQVITPRTRAVITVHLAGWPCDMESICSLARSRGLFVIEDCAQSHGAMYKGKYAGTFGDVAAWSFCQDKIMTTGGEGGMLTTDNCEIWEKAWSYKDHGKSYDAVYNRSHAPGFRWLHEDFGTNWRMTEMQAAIGRAQLRKLPGWIAARRRNANILIERLSKYPCLRVPVPEAYINHSYYKFYAYISEESLEDGWGRDRIMTACNERGVPCFSGICGEIYLEKAFAGRNLQPSERLRVARRLADTSLMFLVHPTLSEQDMHSMADTVCDILDEATETVPLADAA